MDLYEVLGVGRDASQAEIRRAYQRLSRRLHPAVNPGDSEAARRFADTTRAFEVLSDPQRRAQYDRVGEARPVAPSVPDVGFAGFDFSAEVRASGIGFREIFEGVLPRAAALEPRPGEDLEQSTRISFEECFRGTRRRVHLVRHERCQGCAGAGVQRTEPAPCPACGGSGEVRARRGRMVFTRRCPQCGGARLIAARACPRCAGEGRVMHSEWLDVDIPAGVQDGARLTLAGFGNAGARGGPPGDFHLVVFVENHLRFRREGDDLFCEVPLSITEAALGVHVEVATPDGAVTIEAPAGTQAGQRFRLRKRGMPRLGGGRGDLYVEARVVVPAVFDD
ncbi:MAG TPA: J domain-containing protein, partial [Vicinamibacteria bacterium]|nr:J domain-containing protein [Vicinamibacteria bacterium]